nr:hypothetical protein 1573p1_00032 [Serratia marcescens]
MNIVEQPSWMVFSGEENNLESCKVGKWMYFFDATEVSLLFIHKVCVTAIEERIIVKCKYTSPELCMLKGSGMACFISIVMMWKVINVYCFFLWRTI